MAIPSDDVGRDLDRRMDASPVRVAPGALRALKELGAMGIRLGVVSNLLHETPEGLRDLLARLGLSPHFRSIVLSSEHPWAKPRPEPFRVALAELRVRPAHAVHVGDLLYDVEGAGRAGMGSVLYTGLHRFEPRRVRQLTLRIDPRVPRCERWADLPSRFRS